MSLQPALATFVELHNLITATADAAELHHDQIEQYKEQSTSQLETFAIRKMTDRSAEMCKILRNYIERIKEDTRQIDPNLFPIPEPVQIVAPDQQEGGE